MELALVQMIFFLSVGWFLRWTSRENFQGFFPSLTKKCQVLVWQALSTCDLLRALSTLRFASGECFFFHFKKILTAWGFSWRESHLRLVFDHFRDLVELLSTESTVKKLGQKVGGFHTTDFFLNDSEGHKHVINLQILKLKHLTWWRMLMLMRCLTLSNIFCSFGHVNIADKLGGLLKESSGQYWHLRGLSTASRDSHF